MTEQKRPDDQARDEVRAALLALSLQPTTAAIAQTVYGLPLEAQLRMLPSLKDWPPSVPLPVDLLTALPEQDRRNIDAAIRKRVRRAKRRTQ